MLPLDSLVVDINHALFSNPGMALVMLLFHMALMTALTRLVCRDLVIRSWLPILFQAVVSLIMKIVINRNPWRILPVPTSTVRQYFDLQMIRLRSDR